MSIPHCKTTGRSHDHKTNPECNTKHNLTTRSITLPAPSSKLLQVSRTRLGHFIYFVARNLKQAHSWSKRQAAVFFTLDTKSLNFPTKAFPHLIPATTFLTHTAEHPQQAFSKYDASPLPRTTDMKDTKLLWLPHGQQIKERRPKKKQKQITENH